jgi:hypothetical protein
LITGKTANNKIEIYMINRIKNRKRLAPFWGCPRITRITRIESCKAAFVDGKAV